MTAPPVLVVMGVSGAGKSTVGKALADALTWPFEEGDDLHPAANVAKMKAGVPLTDEDREPWLAAIARWIDQQAANREPGIITCSALKRAYRDRLRDGRPQVWLVFLEGSRKLIGERLAHRKGHFMPPALLDSQFAALEEPGADEPVIDVDIARPMAEQVREVETALGLGNATS
jgi:carbohydrate kinase (thermoresistant glucokinase family)